MLIAPSDKKFDFRMTRSRSAMNAAPTPWLKHIVLVGGGHAQVQLLRRLGMRPEPGIKVTLICKDTHTPYSGMLPGYIAGHYGYDDIHIDLARLCAWAGVSFVRAEVTGLNPDTRQVMIAGRPALSYDVVSINTGSTPDLDSVPGAREHALPVKPIASLLERWQALRQLLERDSEGATKRLVCVGAGVGGCELLLSVHHYLGQTAGSDGLAYHLVGRAREVLPYNAKATRRAMQRHLTAKGVALHLGQGVARVEPQTLVMEDGERLPFDALLWVTGAVPAPWFTGSGLATDARGFLATDDQLRSLSHPDVFAVGDCASQVKNPREKAGVFAVRQGPVLAENLLCAVKGLPLRRHVPQRRFLSLIATGERYALASKGPFATQGAWVWRWKDHIDRSFMQRFSDLPPMAAGQVLPNWSRHQEATQTEALEQPLCKGCGGKLGSSALASGLGLLGLSGAAEDAAALPGTELVQSVDWLSLPLSDAYLSGQIIAAHSLSDIYAEGGQPFAAMALANVERQAEWLAAQDLAQMLAGARQVLEADQVALIGGHTSQGGEAGLGLSVTGRILPGQARWTKGGAQVGDLLMLSRPLGSGLLLAGLMAGRTKGRWLDAAAELMARSNRQAAVALRTLPAEALHAVSDVTGFGLAGHAREIAEASALAIRLDLADLPVLEGALSLVEQGVRASLWRSNRRALGAEALEACDPRLVVACDPQTSGGLLAAVAPGQATALEQAGFVAVGQLLDPQAAGHARLVWQ